MDAYEYMPLYETADYIFKTFLNGKNSELETNVQVTKVNSAKQRLAQCANSNFFIPPKDIFEDLRIQIVDNISDTYSRFKSQYFIQHNLAQMTLIAVDPSQFTDGNLEIKSFQNYVKDMVKLHFKVPDAAKMV